MSETITDSEQADLVRRRYEFAVMLGLPVGMVANLEFCQTCGGNDYQWTDWSMTTFVNEELLMFDPNNIATDAADYRRYLAETACTDCSATGFEAGQNFVSESWR